MITHIVFFKLPGNSAESVEQTRSILAAMEGKIPQLKYLEVGTDIIRSERSYDIALLSKFDTLEDLQAYQVHPVHQKVIEHIKSIQAATVAVDYKSGE